MTTKLLFVGLGNYTHPNTRHNVGMMVLDSIVKQLDLVWTQHRPWKSHMAQVSLSILNNKKKEVMDVQVTFLKPRLLMNISGSCVAKAVNELSIPPSNIYVFHDDLQRPLGKLSMKTGGSANGHNGVKSVMEKLGTDAFRRVRIGIGRPEDRSPDVVADFVLNKFTTVEMETLESLVYPLMAPGPGLGLETLCIRGELWKAPNPVKEKKKKQDSTVSTDIDPQSIAPPLIKVP
ncbi:peptidyl-tRNA hydrolase-domain-containing protein [Halteromyces radiatus]|uniref:peptidyl-tRNA hydrolase-domain-containing protein n=1 Tax=Halteromyces radiatus TaxID=101107 RepID=UPI00221F3D15|nr:peptidyl-tRNA hydrolase-domain-containing protein [Halteromyces radiatus]KAI8088798.1 peptidyl-tRNA hydrolase-domain-containing protein [Halteromyces radiatus]